MKILFISSWFPNKLESTNGNFVQRHAEAVSLMHEVEVLHVIGDFNQEKDYIFDDKIINSIHTLVVYYKKSGSSVNNFIRKMKAYKIGFSRMNKPHLVHGNILYNNMLFAVYLKKKYNIPFVVTEHWSALQKENLSKTSLNVKRIARYIARNASYIIPVSYNLSEGLKTLGIKKIRVISNVVDTSIFTINRNVEKNNVVKFLHVSSLSPLKRTKDIIKAIYSLHQSNYTVSLEIGGDGDTTPLKELVKSLNADSYIRMFEEVTHEEVAVKMQNSDYFILFSENETQGCVILESYACGKPVVASKVGGAAELLIHGSSIGVDKNNTEQLYEVLEKICKKEYTFEADLDIRKFVEDHYSKEVIARQFTEVYDEII